MDTHIYIEKLSYYNLKKRIKKNEGFSIKPYKDKLGFLTIGYGHLILKNEKHLLKKKLKKTDLEIIFKKDFNKAVMEFNVSLRRFTSNNLYNCFYQFMSDKNSYIDYIDNLKSYLKKSNFKNLNQNLIIDYLKKSS